MSMPLQPSGWRLDLAAEQLWHNEEKIPLTTKAFALLCYFVTHAHQLLDKQAIFEGVWPGIYVTEGEIRHYVRVLRKILKDNPRKPSFIETAHGRGYRYIGNITVTDPILESKLLPDNSPNAPTAEQSILPGRENELAQLERHLDRVQAGEKHLVLISGELGIGKTALLKTFIQRMAARNTVWLAGNQCVQRYGQSEPYMPVLAALEQLCGELHGQWVMNCIKHHAPSWLLQMPSLLDSNTLSEIQPRIQGTTPMRMLRELAQLLPVLCAERTLILWFEDLQWADTPTLELIGYLGRWAQLPRLFIIGTVRPVAIHYHHHFLARLWVDLSPREFCHELILRPLREIEIARYLRSHFAGLPKSLVRIIYLHSGGNPLFLINIMEHLVTKEIITRKAEGWLLTQDLSSAELGIPKTLRPLIANEIDQLPVEYQRILEVASVVGVEFNAIMLSAALGFPLDAVENHSATLTRHGQFIRSKGLAKRLDGTLITQYEFSHILYQRAFYERVPSEQRMHLQKLINERPKGKGNRKDK